MSLSGVMILCYGLYYLIKGQIRTGGRVLRGTPARLLGLLIIAGLFLPAVIGFVWAIVRVAQEMSVDEVRVEMRPYARLINWGSCIGCLVLAIVLSYVLGESPQADTSNDAEGHSHVPPSDNPYEPPTTRQ